MPRPECPVSLLHGYGVAGLQGCSALRKAFFSNGSAAHPWVARAPHRRAALSIKRYEKILVKKVHEALPKVFDTAGFVLDGRATG